MPLVRLPELQRHGATATVTEDELLEALLELVGLTGWRAYHVRRSDRALVQGRGGGGFPDIVAVERDGSRIVAIECKAELGTATYDQLAWLRAFRRAGIEATIVRPSSYDRAIDWLRGRDAMPDEGIGGPVDELRSAGRI